MTQYSMDNPRNLVGQGHRDYVRVLARCDTFDPASKSVILLAVADDSEHGASPMDE